MELIIIIIAVIAIITIFFMMKTNVKELEKMKNDGFDSIGTTYNCEIVFQDGKKSFALLSSFTYQVIMGRMYDKE